MSDISRTTTGAPPQQTQQQERSVSQEQPRQENQQRFAQKLKEERHKKASAKENDKSKDTEKSKGKDGGTHNPSSAARQAANKAQTASGLASAHGKEGRQSLDEGLGKGSSKGATEHLLEEKSKTPSPRGDAILQGLQPHVSGENIATQETQQTKASIESSDRLFQEFQNVADRVMHTSQSLQQGGSVRLQLGNNVLPGTSVTFSMAGGALHVTFAGNNKKSLAKVREHEAGLVAHVRKQSGVDIVVATQDGQDGGQEPDQQQGGSL